MYLYHYYDAQIGPFMNLSDLPILEAKAVLEGIRTNKPGAQSARRDELYVEHRHNCERRVRAAFEKIGGVVKRDPPHYMVVEHSPWLSTWFENSTFIKIPIEAFDLTTVSFCYGDSMPTFSDSITDGREYRKKVYHYRDMLALIDKYGLPQHWNDDGKHGPERYIEVHIWNDDPIAYYQKRA